VKYPKIHIVHVGSVTNKGTYALLKSELLELGRIYKHVEISVSTSDVEELRRLEPDLEVRPPLVDIPYERADIEARRHNCDRDTLTFKSYLLAYTTLMFLQPFLSIIAGVLISVGIRTYRAETFDWIVKSDLIVSTADENFKEGSSNLPFNLHWMLTWWSMLFARAWNILIPRKLFKKPIIVFPNSVGPFRTRFGRLLARIALSSVDLIFLRESFSRKSLDNLKIKTPTIITSDIALLFKACDATFTERLPRPAIGVSPGFYAASLTKEKQQGYISAICRALDQTILETGADIVFLPHAVTGFKGDDQFICRKIMENMKQKSKSRIVNAQTLEHFENYLGQLDLLISSRMHPTVLGCLNRVPPLVIFYDYKQTGFLAQLGLENCAIDINNVSFEELLLKMRLIWNRRDEIREQLGLRIPLLQEDVKKKISEVCLSFLGKTWRARI
jgi:colanic acid/amylovoran biosynthesis protein